MIYLLDTKLLSQEMTERPLPKAFKFLQGTRAEFVCLSVITLGEIRTGITLLRLRGHRLDHADRLEIWLTRTLVKRYGDRILTVTAEIADEAGRLYAAEKLAARTPQWPDLMLAATAKVYGLTVVTLNRRHFDTLGVPVVAF